MRQTETRSETERHWNILGMTTLTVATAAVAAVFLITRNSQQSPGPAGDLDLFNSLMAFFASGSYLAVAGLVGMGVFGGSNLAGERSERWKRERTHEAFGAFWTMLLTTAFIAFTTFTLPAIQSWYQQQEPLNPGAPTAGNRNLQEHCFPQGHTWVTTTSSAARCRVTACSRCGSQAAFMPNCPAGEGKTQGA